MIFKVNYDECDVAAILQKYRSVINNNGENFEFVSRVLSDYNEFHPEMKSKERTRKFLDDKWGNYKDFFDLKSAESTTEEMVILLTITNVLRSRKVIAEIKGKVKL